MTSASDAIAAETNHGEAMAASRSGKDIFGIVRRKKCSERIRNEVWKKNNPFLRRDVPRGQGIMRNILKFLSRTQGSMVRLTVAKCSIVVCFWNAASSS